MGKKDEDDAPLHLVCGNPACLHDFGLVRELIKAKDLLAISERQVIKLLDEKYRIENECRPSTLESQLREANERLQKECAQLRAETASQKKMNTDYDRVYQLLLKTEKERDEARWHWDGGKRNGSNMRLFLGLPPDSLWAEVESAVKTLREKAEKPPVAAFDKRRILLWFGQINTHIDAIENELDLLERVP